MSHYHISYADLPFLKAERLALEDIREYTGNAYYQKLVNIARSTFNPRQVRFGLAMMVGIEGYPAGAFIREYMPHTNETGDYGEINLELEVVAA